MSAANGCLVLTERGRPTDNHGVRPNILVVFSDELAVHHFLRVALEEIGRTGVDLPLRVSHANLVEAEGAARGGLADAWEPGFAFGSR